jgi:hypothetical protein
LATGVEVRGEEVPYAQKNESKAPAEAATVFYSYEGAAQSASRQVYLPHVVDESAPSVTGEPALK